MAVGPVRVGYPRILGLVVLGSESGFRPWIFEFAYLKVSGFFYFTCGSPSGPETIWPTRPINDPTNLNHTPQSLSLTTLTQPGTRRPPCTREQARSREGHSRTALDASHQEPSPSSLYLSLCGTSLPNEAPMATYPPLCLVCRPPHNRQHRLPAITHLYMSLYVSIIMKNLP
jgi:hypothetical protein